MESQGQIGSELDDLVRSHEAHNNRFFNGDPDFEIWAQDDAVTLHGGFGESGRGWAQVQRILRGAASRLSEGRMTFTPIGGQIMGDLAYLVGLEQGTVRLNGGPPQPMKLKVTTILRRSEGRWLRLHRHGEIVR